MFQSIRNLKSAIRNFQLFIQAFINLLIVTCIDQALYQHKKGVKRATKCLLGRKLSETLAEKIVFFGKKGSWIEGKMRVADLQITY